MKGPRPMNYQYLNLDMIATAKQRGGFIDQKTFKTVGKYGFNPLVLKGYILYVTSCSCL